MAPRTAKKSPPTMPKRIRATIPPTSEPASPRPTVAYQGIGSGPGSASRARPPTTKPHTIRPMMKISTTGLLALLALAELFPDEQDPLEHRPPSGRSEEVDRPLQRSPRPTAPAGMGGSGRRKKPAARSQ